MTFSVDDPPSILRFLTTVRNSHLLTSQMHNGYILRRATILGSALRVREDYAHNTTQCDDGQTEDHARFDIRWHNFHLKATHIHITQWLKLNRTTGLSRYVTKDEIRDVVLRGDAEQANRLMVAFVLVGGS